MKKKWLAEWVRPEAMAYRASLEMGERIGKDANFILQVMAAADVIRMAECERAEAENFGAFWEAMREGEDFEGEAERAFARALAPLLLGNSKGRARLRRLLDCAEQKAVQLQMPKQDAPRLLLRIAREERVKARKAGMEIPLLKSIIGAFRDAGGELDTKVIKRHLRKMGIVFEPMKARGKDKMPRRKSGAGKN